MRSQCVPDGLVAASAAGPGDAIRSDSSGRPVTGSYEGATGILGSGSLSSRQPAFPGAAEVNPAERPWRPDQDPDECTRADGTDAWRHAHPVCLDGGCGYA